jgi:molybdopterin molybdotransferase
MLSLEAAREQILSAIRPLPAELVPLWRAAGRRLAADLAAPLDLPLFDNSAMDGYAVQSAGLLQASSGNPTPLRCRGEIPAGDVPGPALRAGECRRIFTGAPLPAGVDAVVMQEDTRIDPAQPETVWVQEAVRPWDNVRFRGEDLKAGAVIARTGERLNFARLAVLGAVGLDQVSVTRRPVLGLLATGNELVEPGGELAPGQIFESNRLMIDALVRTTGCEPVIFPIVRDDPDATRTALAEAFARCEIVITTGGVSVGAHDHVKAAFENMGGRLEFWKIAIRPGKPFVWGRLGERHLFGLPGNPVSAAVTFLLLVRPALIRLQGGADGDLPVTKATLAGPVSNPGGRRHFMRVRVDELGRVLPAGLQGSHALSGLAAAHGLLEVPPGTTWEAGRPVEVLCFP